MLRHRDSSSFFIFSNLRGTEKNEDKSTVVFCIKTWAGLIKTAFVPSVFLFGAPLLLGGWGAEGRVDDT